MGEAKRRQGAQAEQGDQRFMPRFAFIRRLDLEREAGLLLAGTLIVDIPKSRKTPLPHEEQMIAEIIRELVDAAEAGKLPDDANRVIFGWPGGRRPDDVSVLDDIAAIEAWMAERVTIGVRVDPHDDLDLMRLDSEALLHMGVVKRQ